MVLSVLQFNSLVFAEEVKIYDPTNPNQQVKPIENTHVPDSTDYNEESEVKKVPEKPVKTKNEKEEIKKNLNNNYSSKRDKEKIYLTEDLFNENISLNSQNEVGGDDSEEDSFYLELINEFVGTVIYGRKS
ncbi:hypothetical protein IGL98_003408 [Enterococcus sp. DIV0840]|uniref:hypothetical protein n=1 Tax=Enterococcus TaxID=1350 RepID=UPI001A8C00FB|nr:MULTISPECIES: hypothetical protein [Enterococcus]MBO0433153.1 hypothetical protein [Enterococcus sp. DIV0849a]MBO0473890.1 hypothetical protein [Enterococcus ureasiticus]